MKTVRTDLKIVEDDSEMLEKFRALPLSAQIEGCLAIINDTNMIPITLIRHVLTECDKLQPSKEIVPFAPGGSTWFLPSLTDFNPPVKGEK